MRVGKVLSLSITGYRSRVFKLHDEVNETQFPSGVFDQLIEKKAIELTGEQDGLVVYPVEEPEIIHKEVEDVPQGIKEAKAREEKEGVKDEQPREQPVIISKGDADNGTRKEIMEMLDKAGIAYSKKLSTTDLHELWRAKGKK
jgi:hypothetical protein